VGLTRLLDGMGLGGGAAATAGASVSANGASSVAAGTAAGADGASTAAALPPVPPAAPPTVVDFGSSSGNLGLPLAFFFPHCRFVLVDYKDRPLQIAMQRAKVGIYNL
jgi:hypothetical protein